ncbi:hypothetical protein BG003_001978 [Podila horticola]|nr:hypothetical protein BG003_001978 [Podila horticola]
MFSLFRLFFCAKGKGPDLFGHRNALLENKFVVAAKIKSIMKAILYLAAALAVVGITLAAPAPVEVAVESCWCEPVFQGQAPYKSPDCCY